MNENMAGRSHVLALFLQIYLVFLNVFYVVTVKKCADVNCKVPILMAVAVDDHESVGEYYINFKKGDQVTIFSKHVGADESIWEGSVRGAPVGFLKSGFVKEHVRLTAEDKLVEVASKDESDLKATTNKKLPGGSHQEDGIDITHITADGQADSFEDINESPAESPSEESNQAGDKDLMNENKDDDTEHSQDEITNQNEKTVLLSEPGNSPTDEDSLYNENNDPQVAMANDETDTNVRNSMTEVYTDPNGVQYDVNVEYSSLQEKNDNDDLKFVEGKHQEQSDVDDPEKRDDRKESGELNSETLGVAGGDKETAKKKKQGFFSSFTTLVTNFTENIIKDFSGQDVENDKVKKDNQEQDQNPEEHQHGDKTDQQNEPKESVDKDSNDEETNRKLTEVEGVLESVEEIKEEQLEMMNETINAHSREASLLSVAEVEKLRDEANRLAAGNSGQVKVGKQSEAESKTAETDDELKNKDMITTSQESAGVLELSTKTYSDKVLCSSVAIADREVCMDSGGEEECLMDNCCFDETAEPGKKCFYKPSTPESDITEEDLISEDDKKMSDKNSDKTVKEGEGGLESSEPVSSTISEQSDQSVDVSNTRNISSDVELDSQRKIDVDGNDDESKNSVKADASRESNSAENPADSAHKTDLFNERNESSRVTVEAINDSNRKKQNEDDIPEAKDITDGEQEIVSDKIPSEYVDVIEEVIKNIAETDGVDEQLTTDDKDDSSQEVKLHEDVEERNEKTSFESKDDSRSSEEVSTSSSSGSLGEPDTLKKDATEGRNEDTQERGVNSDQGLNDDSSSEQKSPTEEDVRDAAPVDDKEEAAGEDVESIDKIDELETKDTLKTESEDSSGEAVEGNEVKSDDTGRKNYTEELTTSGSVSGENIEDKSRQQSSKADITAVEDAEEETSTSEQDSQDNEQTSEAPSPEDISEKKQEAYSENQSNEKIADSTVDVEEILNNVNVLLPSGDTKQDTKSKDEESLEDIKDKENEPDVKPEPLLNNNETNLNETSAGGQGTGGQGTGGQGTDEEDSQDNVPLSEASVLDDVPEEKNEVHSENQSNEKNGESTVNVEGILSSIKNFLSGGGTKESTKSKDSFSNGKESKSDVKFEPHQDDNETDFNKTNAGSKEEQGTNKDLDGSQTSTKDILAEFLEEESSDAKSVAVSDAIIPETKDEKHIEEKSVESGSTHYLDSSEPTVPVEKTLDKESNDSSLEGREDARTEIKNTISGMKQGESEMEETKTGLEGAETGTKETTNEVEHDIVPTKTIVVEPSQTIIAGQRPFEKKFPNIASKWMKNKLMKGKRIPEKETAEETSARSDDSLSGTCATDGTCEKVNSFSSRAILENYDISDDDDDDDGVNVEPSPEEPDDSEQLEVKSVKKQLLETLAVAVRKFREYHTVAAGYGLQMLKPVVNVVKSLGKQMGVEETIDHLEHEMGQGPQGWISVTLIMIAFTAYCLLNVLCGKTEPPCFGPNLKDIFKTYEGRIRILEEECQSYEEKINNLKNKADEDVENNSALEKQLDDEKHERSKSEEQIKILKEIVKNLNEKVDLLEEESTNLKRSLDEKSERINSMEEQLSGKSKEISRTEEKIRELAEQLKEKDEKKNKLNENIEEYKNLLSKAENDSDRHKTMLQDWNDRYHELQQKYDDISVSNQTLEEQVHFKDNEIEVLRDSLVQINSEVHINSDEELPQEEMQEARSNKIKELMDVSQVRTDYKLCKEEKEKLEDDMKQEVERREKLEGEVEQLEIDLAKSKASEEEIRFKYREADIKLNTLQDYFKNMESDLHRKLTAEEAARMASESELERKLREASTAVQDVELYKKQVDELRKEIDETQQAFRSQISSTEDRAHENWLKFRTAERELEEMKRERDALRRRLYDLETSAKPPVSLDDAVSSTTADNLESSVSRSESPAASVRSSKRNNSNPRKSPSGSPLDERKERTRRKTRDRNSPPSWDSDLGPPSRRRDKDRETPPPPPPLWEPNMDVSPRRKGRRDSPNMPTPIDADMPRRRRERYTPSPPPPPPDSMLPPSRRRPRDRPSPSSSPPPPPPTIFQPRGVGLPMERPPQPLIMGTPARLNSPFNRPPPPEIMTSYPIGGGINSTRPLEKRGGGSEYGPRGPTPPELSRINNEMSPSGVPPFGNIRPTRGNMNLGTQPPPTNISPLRGIPPQMGTPNEESSPYVNSGLIKNAPAEDEPPPPPPFARNGPYRRTPPGKMQTQPS